MLPGRTIPIALAAMLPVGTFFGGVQVQKHRQPIPTASKEAFEEYRKQVIWETFDRHDVRAKIITDEMHRRGVPTIEDWASQVQREARVDQERYKREILQKQQR